MGKKLLLFKNRINGPYRHTRKFLESCHVEVDKMTNKGECLKDEKRYNDVRLSLEKMLYAKFASSSSKVHFYGSRIIGVADNNSDLDIFIEMNDNFKAEMDNIRDSENIRKIFEMLNENSQTWSVESCVDKARVPVIKALYLPLKLKCDITVSNGIGVQSTAILKSFFELQPEARQLFHFMKIFLPRYDKNFDGYMLKLLVVFFLQSENILPSVYEMTETYYDELITTKAQYHLKSPEEYGLTEMMDFRIYVPRFFKFYAKIKYSKQVMSVYFGKILLIDDYEAIYPESTNDDALLKLFGPVDAGFNVGKRSSNPMAHSFVGTSIYIYFTFLNRHYWNLEYEKLNFKFLN